MIEDQHHLQLAPGGLLVLGDEVEGAHLGQEVAAEGTPAGQPQGGGQKEPKFKMCVTATKQGPVCHSHYRSRSERQERIE